jgi:chromodomain-helicase-DNA-binding protein 4
LLRHLLTFPGTPLQNNKRELFNLVQFVDQRHSAEELDLKYPEITKDNVHDVHDLIRPYFFRRTKAQVLKHLLPPMAQIILPVTMTYLQETLSKSIIAKNADLIRSIVSKSRIKAGERKGLNNILMELRRCLCHPFLFSDSVEDRTVTDPAKIQQNLVEASGKLLLLNIMLPKLKERGHRVLIFSQFLMSLTILEDFLTALGLPHARIDGNTSSLDKQRNIDAFNEPDSPLFAMLLSTRAGGVGINLATADTVIIYDPDFNPHQDIQALSRAHRIGQKNKVLCFQLTTKDTVEERIMQIGRKKMALDHALIESMDAPDDAGDDLESILKHGTEALFSGDAREKITYDSASVDKLLDRSQIEDTKTDDEGSAEAQFTFARVWANDEGILTSSTEDQTLDDATPADKSVWENILKQRQEEHAREVAANRQEYGRGARRRNQVCHAEVCCQSGLC